MNPGSDVQSEDMYTGVTWKESLYPSEHDVICLLTGRNDPMLSVRGIARSANFRALAPQTVPPFTVALFTQRLRIISGVVVRQFSADGALMYVIHTKCWRRGS